MEISIYLARQPVYDQNSKIQGYELLYRSTEGGTVSIQNNLQATARVLVNALNYIGLNNLTKGLPAFVKVDHTALLDDIIYSIVPSHFVLEILEGSRIDDALLARIEKLKGKGYRFALNRLQHDAMSIAAVDELIPLLEYVKVDLSKPDMVKTLINNFKPKGIKFIAEKIEDKEAFEQAKSLGCDLFQGYFLSKPFVMKKELFDPDNTILLDLIYLHRISAPIEELLETFNKSAYLTISLLRYVHLHENLEKDTISSIEQALLLIGREKLGSWLELMVYASIEVEGSEADRSYAEHLSERAHERAKLMEELARKSKSSNTFAQAAYMTGLLSIAEEMFKNRFNDLLKEIHIDKNIATALTKRNGELGQLLQLAIAVEKDDLPTINSIIGQLYISQAQLNEAVLKSYGQRPAL
jgi:EAL and modified HD-GYP domain-containing signal transduction protein